MEMFALQMDFLFQSTMEDPRLLRVYVCLLQATCQRHFGSVLLQFLIDQRLTALQRPDSKVPLESQFCSNAVPSVLKKAAQHRRSHQQGSLVRSNSVLIRKGSDV